MKLVNLIIILLTIWTLPGFTEENPSGIVQKEDRSYLEVFTFNERCIIEACENQLNGTFFMWYAEFLRKDNITLKDIASVFYNFKNTASTITIDTFFEYLQLGMDTEFLTDFNDIYKRTKVKVWSDYNFIKHQKERAKQEKEFFDYLYDKPFIQSFIREVYQRYEQFLKGELE